jgi:hypothetical protein
MASLFQLLKNLTSRKCHDASAFRTIITAAEHEHNSDKSSKMISLQRPQPSRLVRNSLTNPVLAHASPSETYLRRIAKREAKRADERDAANMFLRLINGWTVNDCWTREAILSRRAHGIDSGGLRLCRQVRVVVVMDLRGEGKPSQVFASLNYRNNMRVRTI